MMVTQPLLAYQRNSVPLSNQPFSCGCGNPPAYDTVFQWLAQAGPAHGPMVDCIRSLTDILGARPGPVAGLVGQCGSPMTPERTRGSML